MRPQEAANRHAVFLVRIGELIEITALAPVAGPDYVSRNLASRPDLG
jgi:hypothetical protein